ncbi:hypothetical protein GGX14DRAFT_373622 [Mycena pura]|uniref:Uncharacterized protein n=1 Tax=Mycena pura TaxID=153505 RepID=A0AAD6Y841_9AGAR|nr:hypothetical protein GGX14DRAFT_373622 [Mycena pura]
MTTLELRVIVYGSRWSDPEDADVRNGSDQRRVEILLNPIIPAEFATTREKRHEWVQGFIDTITWDVKHNRKWCCSFCTEDARETYWMKSTWMHLTPPRMVCYVYNVCDLGPGPCSEKLCEIEAEFARLSNAAPTGVSARRSPDEGYNWPMSASCAHCHDEAPSSLANLKKCSSCELTRYCRSVAIKIILLLANSALQRQMSTNRLEPTQNLL